MNINIQQPYFDQIVSRLKIWEARLNQGKWKDIVLDDLFIIRNSDSDESVLRIVKDIKYYSSFKEAFQDLQNDLLPGVTTSEQAQRIYGQFYDIEDIMTYGVIVFQIN